MAQVNPEQLSGEWIKDVGTTAYEKQDIRTALMTKAALLSLKLKHEVDLDTALNDPKKNGLSSLEDLTKVDKFEHTVVKRDVLNTILKDYFKSKVGVNNVNLRREVNVALYFLSKEGVDTTGRTFNVDLLHLGSTVSIENGRLTITEADGTISAKDVLLRPDGVVAPSVTPEPLPVPEPTPEPAPVPVPPTAPQEPERTPDIDRGEPSSAEGEKHDEFGEKGGFAIPPRPNTSL